MREEGEATEILAYQERGEELFGAMAEAQTTTKKRPKSALVSAEVEAEEAWTKGFQFGMPMSGFQLCSVNFLCRKSMNLFDC